MKQKLSIKAISELSKVSVATVSRVINQNGRFSAETERRVKEVIAQYGYVPNMLARGLRTNQLPIIGIIVPDITNEFFAQIVLDMQMLLFDHGYSVTICNTNESEELERMHLKALGSHNVSGLVYISGGRGIEENELDLPVVYIDRRPKGRQTTRSVVIESDNEQGGYLATNELIRCGCRKLVLLIDQFGPSSRMDRLRGYEKAVHESALSMEVSLVEVTSVSYQDAYDGIIRYMDAGKTFDGIACGTDWMAIGALSALRERGVRVPQDVQVVGFDDISTASIFAIPVTTIRQDTKAMASLAVEQMMKLLEGLPVERSQWILPVELVKRSTTR